MERPYKSCDICNNWGEATYHLCDAHKDVYVNGRARLIRAIQVALEWQSDKMPVTPRLLLEEALKREETAEKKAKE
jgi:hypothetical protein